MFLNQGHTDDVLQRWQFKGELASLKINFRHANLLFLSEIFSYFHERFGLLLSLFLSTIVWVYLEARAYISIAITSILNSLSA